MHPELRISRFMTGTGRKKVCQERKIEGREGFQT